VQPLPKAFTARLTKLGFDTYGVVDLADYDSREAGLRAYLEAGHHGSMSWMAETAARRVHPQNMWKAARSAIVLGLNYGPECNPLENLQHKDKATISVYARGADYHQLIKGRLKEAATLLARDTGADVKVFVDTAPLMEKPLAAAAGLGWQGKHTNLLSRDFGSWLFLGVILSAARLEPTRREAGGCGSCRACLDICPTNAFPEPYRIDARLCISYLTIEHKGPVELSLRPKLGNRIYGCDDCLAVCPWNKFAKASREIKLKARPELERPDLAALAALDEAGFRALFAGSPIKRIGRARFLRNVLYAIGNSEEITLAAAARAHLSSPDAVVRDAAAWALERLGSSPAQQG